MTYAYLLGCRVKCIGENKPTGMINQKAWISEKIWKIFFVFLLLLLLFIYFNMC